jgi:hypothetical protein
MSDTFDHFSDAMEDMMPGGRSYEGDFSEYKGNRSSNNFKYDELHYHTMVMFTERKAETEKAVLLVIDERSVMSPETVKAWIPKALCKNWQKDSVHILTNFWRKMLEKNDTPHGEEHDEQ